MRTLIRFIDRFVPALLMAAGVTLLAAGLLSYASPALGDPALPSEPPSVADPFLPTQEPESEASPSPPQQSPGASPSTVPGPSSAPTTTGPGAPSPGATATPVAPPTAAPPAVATRVVIPSTRVDLPIISRLERVPDQGPDRYPPCDVALYHDAFGQPSQEGSTYLYAHAREGMFLSLLDASMRQDGAELLGALVQVYTDDDRLFLYSIDRVKRHALDYSLAINVPAGEQRLILQTSEGPRGTVPKLQIAATLVSEVPADPSESHPRAQPRACYDTP